jgi:hypothetical protein
LYSWNFVPVSGLDLISYGYRLLIWRNLLGGGADIRDLILLDAHCKGCMRKICEFQDGTFHAFYCIAYICLSTLKIIKIVFLFFLQHISSISYYLDSVFSYFCLTFTNSLYETTWSATFVFSVLVLASYHRSLIIYRCFYHNKIDEGIILFWCKCLKVYKVYFLFIFTLNSWLSVCGLSSLEITTAWLSVHRNRHLWTRFSYLSASACGELVLGGFTEYVVEEYLLFRLYCQYDWWGREVFLGGHDGILQSVPLHCAVCQVKMIVNTCTLADPK